MHAVALALLRAGVVSFASTGSYAQNNCQGYSCGGNTNARRLARLHAFEIVPKLAALSHPRQVITESLGRTVTQPARIGKIDRLW
jgi:hypothetical protein